MNKPGATAAKPRRKPTAKRAPAAAPPLAEPKALIFNSLNLIMDAIQPIIKKHTHEQGFDFTKMDDITAELRPLLIQNRVLTIPHEIPEHIENVRSKLHGELGILIFTKLRIVWRLYALDGSFLQATTWGEGMSEMHFSTAAAQTMSFKAMLEKVFVLPLLTEKTDPQEEDLHGATLIETPLEIDESFPARTMAADPAPASAQLTIPATPVASNEPITRGMLNIIKSNLANCTAVDAISVCKKFGLNLLEGEKTDDALLRLTRAQMPAVVDWIQSQKAAATA